jgi:hypothetical protein
MCRGEQAVHVLPEPEDGGAAALGPVAADSLEHPDAVMERVRKDVDLRRVPVDEFPVQPDLLCLGDHGRPPAGIDVLFLQRYGKTVNPEDTLPAGDREPDR